jgi:endonuclease/exonuclease/phosphatase family metal-dependent hydrolase
MRRRLTLLVVCLMLAVPAPAQATPVAALRVLTFNMHTGIGEDGRLDLGRTAGLIRSSGADVVGLQEVDVHWADRSDFRDQAADLAALLHMWVFFAPIYDLPPLTDGQPDRRYGVAVLSRFPFIHTENHLIARLSTQDSNPVPVPTPGFAEAVFLTRGGPLHVYVTHLDFRADPSVRAAQVADTLRILGQDPCARQVLLGDFNAEPGAPELTPLWSRLRDAWSGTDPGLTYPAGVPARRIDYVTSSGLRARDARVLVTDASDHRPVLVDF